MQELDVMNLIRTVRMAKVFISSVMTRRQRLLLRFQKQNLIESDTEKSALSSENMLLDDLNHKNNLVRLFTVGNIKKRLMTLTEEKKLSYLDIRLLKGFYTSSRTELETVRAEQKGLDLREDSMLTETIPSDTETSPNAIPKHQTFGLKPESVHKTFPS